MVSNKELAVPKSVLAGLEREAWHRRSIVKNQMCKNTVLGDVFMNKQTPKGTKTVFDFKRESGCKNLRRNGSAYCQECSDNHEYSKS